MWKHIFTVTTGGEESPKGLQHQQLNNLAQKWLMFNHTHWAKSRDLPNCKGSQEEKFTHEDELDIAEHRKSLPQSGAIFLIGSDT